MFQSPALVHLRGVPHAYTVLLPVYFLATCLHTVLVTLLLSMDPCRFLHSKLKPALCAVTQVYLNYHTRFSLRSAHGARKHLN